ncbi:MAG: RNA-binding domain-containing protein [bacterium]
MKKSELLELIKQGESSTVEFKEENISPDKLAREIIAFANSDGGFILIGVDDNGKIKGIKKDDIEEWAVNICRNNCSPSLIPIYEKNILDGKIIAVIKIPRSEGIIHRSLDGHYYIRVGTTVRDATPQELARLFQRSKVVHNDILPVYGASISDIDDARIEYYFTQKLSIDIKTYNESKESLLENIKVLIKVDGKNYLTMAGLLIFGKFPERFLTQSGIIAVRFRGNEMDYDTLDRREIKGPLVNQYNADGNISSLGIIDQTIDFIKRNTSVTSRLEDIRRIDTPQYPIEPIREGIVNAIAHRDYTISGAKIRVFVFPDRIEIYSPGKLPNTVTIENLKRTAHYTRNPELYKFLAHYGYADDIGLGIPKKIIGKMKEYKSREPEFIESGEEFVVTLFGKKDNP